MNTPDSPWFDIVTFNFREMGAGMVGVHIWRAGYNCILLCVPKSLLADPLMWEKLKAQADERWAVVSRDEKLCPTCGGLLRLTARRYNGHEFCATCGEAIEHKRVTLELFQGDPSDGNFADMVGIPLGKVE